MSDPREALRAKIRTVYEDWCKEEKRPLKDALGALTFEAGRLIVENLPPEETSRDNVMLNAQFFIQKSVGMHLDEMRPDLPRGRRG